jgi:hypothetical protein
MLQFLERFGFYLADALSGDTHHFPYFFQRKRSEITSYPGTVEEGLIFQAPLTGMIETYFID